MQLRKLEQTQRVEKSKEDSQGNFQIKVGHAQVLELGVSHKQLSHCGKRNELNSDSSHIKRNQIFLFFLGHAGFEVSVRCDGFYECGDMEQWRQNTDTHRRYTHTQTFYAFTKNHTKTLRHTYTNPHTHLQPDCWIGLI